ncbi:unnamed protein product [Caenorhabditis auriculariae]|uniref:Uncharacterized protein n=1 Tax=Caenorhabditis auriculariae TaxID=2777116 RepID=A0A8S1GYP9_9PELO|nr:unnamed protein product [Caenorhabditis auriculariae]
MKKAGRDWQKPGERSCKDLCSDRRAQDSQEKKESGQENGRPEHGKGRLAKKGNRPERVIDARIHGTIGTRRKEAGQKASLGPASCMCHRPSSSTHHQLAIAPNEQMSLSASLLSADVHAFSFFSFRC